MNFKKLKSQSGRSMVEMLGVLALIGVLSVGGIAGYSLSMRRHRANGVVDLVSKFALVAYNKCSLAVINGLTDTITSCKSHDIPEFYTEFEDAGVGSLPAGVSDMYVSDANQNETTGTDEIEVSVDFSDQKLCQAVASIAGSSCAKNGTNYQAKVTIKQN